MDGSTVDFYVSDEDTELSSESMGEPWGEIIRDYEAKPNAKWRFGKPDYASVNKTYFAGRTRKPADRSLEALVTKMIKNWEVESHHINDIKDWQTMDVANFRAFSNGAGPIPAQKMADIGHYNALIGDVEGFKGSGNTFETADEIFSNAFPEGFAIEVLEVYSPPPEVAFKWRHFGKFNGEFRDSSQEIHPGNGKLLEIVGVCVLTLNDKLQIQDMKVYYDPQTQIRPLMTNRYGGVGRGMCPFAPPCTASASDDEEDSSIDQEDKDSAVFHEDFRAV